MKGWLVISCASLKLSGLAMIFLCGWAFLGWLVFFSGGILVVGHMLLPRTQGFCDVVTGFIPEGNQVWVTIDDGPDPEDTPQILDLLDTHNAKATFFMIGRRAELYPELVQAVVDRGHCIGNHTYTHPVHDFWFARKQRVNMELDRATEALAKSGLSVRLFRAPVGIKNVFLKNALRARGLRCVAWTIRSGDGLSHNLQAVVDHVLRKVRPGSIILMHEGEHVSAGLRVKTIRRVLEGLHGRGFTCVIPEQAQMQPLPTGPEAPLLFKENHI